MIHTCSTCTRTHAHTHVHTHAHTHVHTHTHTHIHTLTAMTSTECAGGPQVTDNTSIVNSDAAIVCWQPSAHHTAHTDTQTHRQTHTDTVAVSRFTIQEDHRGRERITLLEPYTAGTYELVSAYVRY